METFNFKDRYKYLCAYYYDKENKSVVVAIPVKYEELPSDVIEQMEKEQKEII